jgi:hypothetical protein
MAYMNQEKNGLATTVGLFLAGKGVADNGTWEGVMSEEEQVEEFSAYYGNGTIQVSGENDTIRIKPITLPEFLWKDIMAARKEACQEARVSAERDYKGFAVKRFRGCTITASDVNDNTVLCSGDGYEMPKTKSEFVATVNQILNKHPEIRTVWVSTGIDGADSPYEMNEGNYEPWIGSGDVELFKLGELK